MLDPAKQLEYAERLTRAWMALWTGWLSRDERGATDPRPCDIFLSHSKRDEARIREIEREFERGGYNVYVDWSDDPLLDRTHVDRETALKLQERMRQCKALVLALSAQSAVALGAVGTRVLRCAARADLHPASRQGRSSSGREARIL